MQQVASACLIQSIRYTRSIGTSFLYAADKVILPCFLVSLNPEYDESFITLKLECLGRAIRVQGFKRYYSEP
jgi:uncharacterized UPF0146 family protein